MGCRRTRTILCLTFSRHPYQYFEIQERKAQTYFDGHPERERPGDFPNESHQRLMLARGFELLDQHSVEIDGDPRSPGDTIIETQFAGQFAGLVNGSLQARQFRRA